MIYADSGSGSRAISIVLGWQLGQQMRPVASDDTAYFVIDGADDLEAFLDCRRIISSSSGLRGRPCRNSIGIPLLHLTAGDTACNPVSTGIGAEAGQKEHRKPSTKLPTDASG
jgi:hypothetical protein